MSRIFLWLLMAAMAAGTAHAQETGTDLSLGEPATGPLPGQTYVREVSGDWEVRCLKAAEGKDRCQLYQLMREANGNPVAEITLVPLPSGQQAIAGANITTPLETLLQRQLLFSIDGADAKRYPFSFCTRAGCVSRVGFTAPEVAALEKGTEAILTIFALANPQNPVLIRLSLNGFTAAYDALLEDF